MQTMNRCLLAALCALSSLAHALPTENEQVMVVSVRARRQTDVSYEANFDTVVSNSGSPSSYDPSPVTNYPAGGGDPSGSSYSSSSPGSPGSGSPFVDPYGGSGNPSPVSDPSASSPRGNSETSPYASNSNYDSSPVRASSVGGPSSGGAGAGGKPRIVTAAKRPGVVSAEVAFKKAAEAATAKRGPMGRTMGADANSAGTVSKDLQTLNGLDEYEKNEPHAVLKEGDVLGRNDSLTNSCGYKFVNQPDGNLVLYHGEVAAPSWASNTAGVGGSKDAGNWTAKMEKGNFALYAPTTSRGRSRRPPIWSTKTQGEGNKAVLTRDGNFVIVDSQSRILFNTVSFSKIPCVAARAKPVAQSPAGTPQGAANPMGAPAPAPAQVPAPAPAPAQVPAPAPAREQYPAQVPAREQYPAQVPAPSPAREQYPAQVPAREQYPAQVPAPAPAPEQYPAQVPAPAPAPEQYPAQAPAPAPAQVPAPAPVGTDGTQNKDNPLTFGTFIVPEGQ